MSRNDIGLWRAVVASATLVFVIASGCVGLGRNRSDEFDARVVTRLDAEEDRWGDRRDRGERQEQDRSRETEQQRSRASSGSSSDDVAEGPLAYLASLHSRVGSKLVSGYALIWEDARIFSSTRLDERSSLGRLGYRPDQWRASGGHTIPVRVVADHGRAVEVETLTADEAVFHCDGAVRSPMDAYRLRMMVPRTELVPVVSSEFDHEYDDGSIIVVPPGVALRPTARGVLVRLARGNVEVPMAPGVDSIGLSYREPGFREGRLAPDPMRGHVTSTAPLMLAGAVLELGRLSEEAVMPRWVRDTGGGSRLFLADDCGAIIAVCEDPSPFVEDDDSGDVLDGARRPASTAASTHKYEVDDGAAAWWPNGERAGVVVGTARHAHEPERVLGKLCFPLMGVVRVCHDEADVGIAQSL